MLTGSLNLTVVTEGQRAVWYILPLLPIFLIFFIGSIAETNRAPFDLAEAESELVSGFMTEHAAVVFVFFFLAEYGSIVLMCILNSLLFLGGYLPPIYSIYSLITYMEYFNYFIYYIVEYLNYLFYVSINYIIICKFWLNLGIIPTIADLQLSSIPYFSCMSIPEYIDMAMYQWQLFIESLFFYYPNLEGLIYGLTLGLKSSIMIFTFIWARASFPRIRFDQLMSFCWTVILPVLFALIMYIPCILHSFDFLSLSFSLQ